MAESKARVRVEYAPLVLRTSPVLEMDEEQFFEWLDAAAWRKEWEKGRSMTLDQAVDYALKGVGDHAIAQGKRAF
jgi:hypothetical protein